MGFGVTKETEEHIELEVSRRAAGPLEIDQCAETIDVDHHVLKGQISVDQCALVVVVESVP